MKIVVGTLSVALLGISIAYLMNKRTQEVLNGFMMKHLGISEKHLHGAIPV